MTDKIIELLKESNALMSGHFLLSSGKHSDKYVQCARLTQYPDKTTEVCKILKEKLKNIEIDTLCGPAMGGIIISYELARTLGKRAIFTERQNNEMALRRGFEVNKGEKILIVEDVVTTGKSSMETIKVLENLGAEVVGIACIVDRTGDNQLDTPLFGATKIDIQTYEAEHCPLCNEKIELIKPGSRKQ